MRSHDVSERWLRVQTAHYDLVWTALVFVALPNRLSGNDVIWVFGADLVVDKVADRPKWGCGWRSVLLSAVLYHPLFNDSLARRVISARPFDSDTLAQGQP